MAHNTINSPNLHPQIQTLVPRCIQCNFRRQNTEYRMLCTWKNLGSTVIVLQLFQPFRKPESKESEEKGDEEGDAEEDEVDAEIFDDDDFYQQVEQYID